MADKELTTFVVDVTPSMETHLPVVKRYIADVVAAKCLRGRKTDFIGLVTVGLPITDNPYAPKSFNHIQVVIDRVAPTYKDLETIQAALTANSDEIDTQDELVGDVFEGLLVAISLMKDTSKLKYIRNVVIFTDGNSAVHLFHSKLALATKDAVNKLGVHLLFVGLGFHINQSDLEGLDRQISGSTDNNKGSIDNSLAQDAWRQKIDDLGGRIISGKDAILSILHRPPMKPVRPMKTYKGPLRFGANPLLQDQDLSSLEFAVEVYPAAKIDTLPSSHLFWKSKEDDQPGRITYHREYYVKKRKHKQTRENADGVVDGSIGDKANSGEGDDDEYEEEIIDPSTRVKGFKFTNYDLIALDDTLSEAVTLHTFLGMDILGLYNRKEFPISYLTGQSYYVVVGSSSTYKDTVGFYAMCSALEQLNSVAVVRYVAKDESEVEICVLYPIKVKKSKDDYIRALSMTRIPFKEDENIGRFPNLLQKHQNGKSQKAGNNDSKVEKDEDSNEAESEKNELLNNLKYPENNINDVMESFILSKDLKVKEKEEDMIDNRKAIASGVKVSSLPQPPEDSWLTGFTLLEPSPGIHKFHRNLRRIVAASTRNGSIGSVDVTKLQDDYELIGEKRKRTNLFNMDNVFALNGSLDHSYLSRINQQSISIAKRLVEELDVMYVTREEAERKKKEQQGPKLRDLFQVDDDDEYDEMPDIDQMLGN